MVGVNPFTPSAGSDPPYLAGRAAEVEQFSSMLRDLHNGVPKNILMYGLRGVDKTVILNKFISVCRDEGFLPVPYFQYAEEHSDPKRFYDVFTSSMNSAIEQDDRGKRLKAGLKQAACHLRPEEIGVAGISVRPSYDSDNGDLTMRITDEIIGKMESIGDGYNGMIFLFDEFHTINGKKDGLTALAAFIGALNEVQRRGYRCAAVLSGLPALVANVNKARSYSERMFRPVEISNLERDGL